MTNDVLDPDTAMRLGLAEALDSCSVLETLDPHDMSFETLESAARTLEQIRRSVEALDQRVLAAIEADGRWALRGARSFAAWVRQTTGVLPTTASRRIRTARALRDLLPAAAEALAAGEIGEEHVTILVRHATDTERRRTHLADPETGEAFLVSQAKVLDAAAFALLVKHWALRADPDAADRAWKDDLDREELFISDVDGGAILKGFLATANAAALKEALAARTGVPDRGDTRTPAQRRANSLVAVARMALDSGALQPGARIRPHIAVTSTLDTLLALVAASCPEGGAGRRAEQIGESFAGVGAAGGDGTTLPIPDGPEAGPLGLITATLTPETLEGVEAATLADGSPIPFGLLHSLACEGHLHRVVFGADSEILDVGREERLFTKAQTRAVIARDRHCQYPGCDAPPGEGEIHHNLWWYAQNGRTDIANAILLCWYHHDFVHSRQITIERHRTFWRFVSRHGAELGITEIRPACGRARRAQPPSDPAEPRAGTEAPGRAGPG